MALNRTFGIGPVHGLGSFPIVHGYEITGSTWLAGSPLINSSGHLATAAADPTDETIVGIAVADASGTADTDVLYIPAYPGMIFEGQIQNAAGTATIALATHMYAEFGINVTSGVWWIDTDETTHKDVLIVGFKDAIGTLNGVVYFMFKPGIAIYSQATT